MIEILGRFMEEQFCASICTIDEEGKPYCFSCFYAFNFPAGFLYFKSCKTSKHAALMKNARFAAGTILPAKASKIIVKGVQFEGIVLHNHPDILKAALHIYCKKHPVAIAVPGEMWILQVNKIKMTDTALGFGKKIIWERPGYVDPGFEKDRTAKVC